MYFYFLSTHLRDSSTLNTKTYTFAAVATSKIHKAIVFEVLPLLVFSCEYIDFSAWYNLNYDTLVKSQITSWHFNLTFEMKACTVVASEFTSALKAPIALWLWTMKDHAWHVFLCWASWFLYEGVRVPWNIVAKL